jgi:ubiquinone/menaquinone biosynthesis C-methylase UbiE
MNPKEWNLSHKQYYEDILSPIKDSRSSPLLKDLKRLRSKTKTIIDLGCGLGELSPTLSKYFKSVTAIDFSPDMISQAKLSHSNLINVIFEQANLSSLSKYKNKFNVALSINSLINPDLNTLDKQLKQIHSVLKKRGIFIAILPAMEVYIYQTQLLKQKSKNHLLKEYTNQKEHNFPLGIIDFDGKQKAYYYFEILWRFQKAGFKRINISRVSYTWKEFKKAGQLSFPSEPLPWDWYVKCIR